MRLIAHRALIEGLDSTRENNPDAVLQCLDLGYDVEIDVRYINQKWYLGHDEPLYQVEQSFIEHWGLWIHAKNPEACFELNKLYQSGKVYLNYFWHENDERTLTSCGYLWTYPGKTLNRNSVAVMPEWNLPLHSLKNCLTWECYGICSDHVKVIT